MAQGLIHDSPKRAQLMGTPSQFGASSSARAMGTPAR